MIHVSLLLAALAVSAEPARGDLTGAVVDAAQRPISQATVFIYTARPRVGLGVVCPSCYVDCGKKATADAAGKFLIPALDSELLFNVLVVAEGFRPQVAKDVDPLRGSLDVKLEAMPADLSGRAVLRGRVLDGAGKPVVGAAVSPSGCKTADKRWWGSMPGVDAASVTNLRGEFLITGNPGDLGYDLEVDARGFAKRLVDLLPTGGTSHEITLTEGATVQGRILKGDKPAAAVAVGLVQCDRGIRFVGLYRIATGADGRFTLANVHPNNEYFIFTTMADAARLGGILLPERIAVGGDGTTKDVGDRELASAVYRVAGRIMLTDGKPIPGGTQMMLSREEAWDFQNGTVAADGSFSFAGVPEEAVTLITRIAGYRLATKRNRVQQVRPGAVAMFVDADKLGLELYFEPEPAAPAEKTSK